MFLGAHGPKLSGFSKYLVMTLTFDLAFSWPTISSRVMFDLTLFSCVLSISSVMILIRVVSEIIELFGFAVMISKP